MPCTIAVSPSGVLGITDGINPIPQTVRVIGTSSGCAEITVSLSCSKVKQNVLPDPKTGVWMVDLPVGLDHSCLCGSNIAYVRVQCLREIGETQPPPGAPCQFEWSGVLVCKAAGPRCPDLVDLQVVVSDQCNPDGTRP